MERVLKWPKASRPMRDVREKKMKMCLGGFLILFGIENWVLQARIEIFGSASSQFAGMMERWSMGIMGLAESGHFFERALRVHD